MIDTNFKSILDLLNTFQTEQSCIDYLTEVRWKNGVISPFDATSKVYKCKNNRYKCKNSDRYFNVLTQTIFENTKLSLQKWFVAIYVVTTYKKGISSIQLAKEIGVTQKTAWNVMYKIRTCFNQDEGKLQGQVEVDETYVGGKNKNRHKSKRVKYSQGRSYKDKTPVFGMIERGGRLRAYVVKDVKGNTIKAKIFENVESGTTIHSDEWWAYHGLGRYYPHKVVQHGKGEYVKDNSHCNTMEGAWAILKRSIMGTHHWVSKKHMQGYVDEFAFRYNYRNLKANMLFEKLLGNMWGRLN